MPSGKVSLARGPNVLFALWQQVSKDGPQWTTLLYSRLALNLGWPCGLLLTNRTQQGWSCLMSGSISQKALPILPWCHGTHVLKEASHQVKSLHWARHAVRKPKASHVERLKCSSSAQLSQPSQLKHQRSVHPAQLSLQMTPTLGCHLTVTAWETPSKNHPAEPHQSTTLGEREKILF